MGNGGPLSGVKRKSLEYDHSPPPFIEEAENGGIIRTSNSSHAFMA
jgi:hypothetical protein